MEIPISDEGNAAAVVDYIMGCGGHHVYNGRDSINLDSENMSVLRMESCCELLDESTCRFPVWLSEIQRSRQI